MPKHTITFISTKEFVYPYKSDPVKLIKIRNVGSPDDEDQWNTCSEDDDDVPTCLERLLSWRWFTAIVTSLGVVFIILLRNCMSMALVDMTGGGQGRKNLTLGDNGGHPMYNNITFFMPRGEFDWDSETQGIILSAAFYSSFIAPAISGFLAKRFGPKIIIGVSVVASGAASLFTPLAARAHVNVLVAVRVFLGFFSGIIFPASLELWSHWAPSTERVQLVSSTYTGINVGSLISSLLSGFLCTIPHDNGWPYVFYLFGGLSLLWCIVWFMCISDTPESHRWISKREALYIAKHTQGSKTSEKSVRPPIVAMLTSGPVWAYIIVQTCHMWCSSIFFAYLPKYMSDVLRYPIQQNAILSSMPFASRFVGVMVWGYMSNLLLRKSSLSVTWIRKLVQSSGFLVCGVFTVGIGFVDEQQRELAVTLFLLAMFCQSSSMSSSSVIPLDIAPRFAGIITGAYMVVGSFMSMFGPMAAAYLTPNGTLEEWRVVFLIIAGVYVIGVAAFVFLGSAEIQPWAMPQEETGSDVTSDPEADVKHTSDSIVDCSIGQKLGNGENNRASVDNENQLNIRKGLETILEGSATGTQILDVTKL